jgi:hypothetical protein
MAARIPGGLDAIKGLSDDDQLGIEFGRQFCQPLGTVQAMGRGGYEPLIAWRIFAAEAYLILRAASALHSSPGNVQLPSSEADELMFGALAPKDREGKGGRVVWVDWKWIQSALDRWLGYGNVRPSLQVTKDKAVRVTLGTAESLTEGDMYINHDRTGLFFDSTCGLFGALAAQLVLVVQNRGGFEFCTECQGYFEPEGRKPRAGERHFCSPECRAKRSKYAGRVYREKKKAAAWRT